MPGLLVWFYRYCSVHALFFTWIALGWYLDFIAKPSEGAMFVFIIFAATAASAWHFWLFDRFDPNDPTWVPIGVRLWATLSRQALMDDDLVDPKTLEERAKRASRNAWDMAKLKAETQRAKLDEYELALAKEHEEAQAELARTARAYNEAKLRAEEAKRRRDRREEG